MKSLQQTTGLIALWLGGLNAGLCAAEFDLQAELAQHPGRIIEVPEGDHEISEPLVLDHDNAGLSGPGRIIQLTDGAEIIKVLNARNVRIRDVTLLRRAPLEKDCKAGIWAEGCRELTIDGVSVLDNPSSTASILINESTNTTIRNSLISNFKCITIDDRTANKELSGYAFRAIDGTGIKVRTGYGTQILNNRIEEHRLEPTKANRDKYGLGDLTVKPEKPGRLMEKGIFETGYTNNWHQGAGIQVSSPMTNQRTLISGNLIVQAPQGLDLHCDNVTVSNNIIDQAMIGMKSMHGARNVLITGNQFMHCDLWGLLLMPGSGSHGTEPAKNSTTPQVSNTDGGHIVANNIFSGFGFGAQYWNWKDRKSEYPERNVITILFGQLEENPAIRNIVITGNVVEDSGANGMLIDGKAEKPGARYHYALYVEQKREPKPINVIAENNVLDPGMLGAKNY